MRTFLDVARVVALPWAVMALGCEAGSLENRAEFEQALAAAQAQSGDATGMAAEGAAGGSSGSAATGDDGPTGDDGASSGDGDAADDTDTGGMDDGASGDGPMSSADDGSSGMGADDGAAGESGDEPGIEEGCAEGCELLQMRCAVAGCHDDGSAAAGLSLAAEGLLERLGDAPATGSGCGDSGALLLDTADPESSLIYGKLLNPPACGARMPLGVPFEEDEIDCIRRWVAVPDCGGTP